MRLGRFSIHQLSEGQFEFFRDGKINRTPVSEDRPKHSFTPKNAALVGINPLYVTDNSYHILLDAGLGWGLDAGSVNTDVSNICTNLDILGVRPEDITHVILSHLHYDHVAGMSFTNAKITTRPTFPNATYIIQQAEWDFAVEQVQHQGVHSTFYKLDDLYRLYADHFFEFTDENEREIIPGLILFKTGGHTPGHQVVKIMDEGRSAYFLGDLVSKPAELNYFDVATPNLNRIQTKKMKVKLLRQAYREKAYLFFYHSLHSRIGQLEKDKDRRYVLKEI